MCFARKLGHLAAWPSQWVHACAVPGGLGGMEGVGAQQEGADTHFSAPLPRSLGLSPALLESCSSRAKSEKHCCVQGHVPWLKPIVEKFAFSLEALRISMVRWKSAYNSKACGTLDQPRGEAEGHGRKPRRPEGWG